MLLLHGLGSSADDWPDQLPALAADYRIIAVDLPGHFRSALPSGSLTIDGMAASVARLLARLGERRVHVVGLSLGGCVALALALREPARVRTLTLVNSFARLRPDGLGALGRLALRASLLAVAPMSGVAAVVARQCFPRPEQASLRGRVRRSLTRTSRLAYARSAVALARFDVRGALGALRCPVLVVAGALDTTVGIDAKDALLTGIAGARWALVAGSGHVTTADQPAAFNGLLREFLAAH